MNYPKAVIEKAQKMEVQSKGAWKNHLKVMITKLIVYAIVILAVCFGLTYAGINVPVVSDLLRQFISF